MLDLKILKVEHETEEEACKLDPYIAHCDIFGLEHQLCTEDLAARAENSWERTLTQGFSPAQFRVSAQSGLENLPKGLYEHMATVRSHLYRSKKPIWFLERFSPEESEELNLLEQRASKTTRSSFGFFIFSISSLLIER